jgi:hypothetical protein
VVQYTDEMKSPDLHRTWGSAILIILFPLLLAAQPVGPELQDSGSQEASHEADFTPLDPDLSEEELAAMGAEAFAAVKERSWGGRTPRGPKRR